jgi:hypothetical protein
VGKPWIGILGYKRSAYLNQGFVIAKVVVDKRLALQEEREKRIEFASFFHLGQRFSATTPPC